MARPTDELLSVPVGNVHGWVHPGPGRPPHEVRRICFFLNFFTFLSGGGHGGEGGGGGVVAACVFVMVALLLREQL